jgi:hypothetical protein
VQNNLDKFFVVHIAQGLIERQLKQDIHTKIAEQAFAQTPAHEAKGRRVRFEKTVGVRAKQADPNGVVPGGCDLADLGDNGLMPAVQPVKIPQRNDRAAKLIRNISKTIKRPHRI